MSDATNSKNQVTQAGCANDDSKHVPSLDEVLEAFEQAWNHEQNAPIAQFIPAEDHPDYEEIVTELLCIDLERRFKNGDAKSIVEYREEFADLIQRTAILERLAFEEYRLLATKGERVHPAYYQKTYQIRTDHWPLLTQAPNAAAALSNHAVSASVSEEMERITGVTKPLPEIGDDFLGFEIREQLGACRFGRVYLARQKTLADRNVVIKVTTNLWSESDVLARLQHTNIVPIYSVHQDSGLQAVCMPFLGRRTLASFLTELKHQRGKPSQTIIDSWIDGGCISGESASRPPQRQLDYLRSLSFEQLCVWIIANVATGLSQAHDRGISHRDLKPANILLTDEFQPLILDFNLSGDELSGGRGSLLVGGTLPYMAPEHLRAVVAEGQIDERSDLYSLGVILFELLTGELPHPTQDGSIIGNLSYLINARSKTPPSVRSLAAEVSIDVDSIVTRCLSASPEHRYQSSQELQEDLENHLQDLPLRHTANRSVSQRWRKWIRRHPRLMSSGSVTVVSFLLLSILGAIAISRGNSVARLEAVESFHHFQQLTAEAVPALSMSPQSELIATGLRKADEALSAYGTGNDDWKTQANVNRLDPLRREQLFESIRTLHYLIANTELRRSKLIDAADRKHELGNAELHNDRARQIGAANETPRALLLQAADIATLAGNNDEAAAYREQAKRASKEDANSKLLSAIRFISILDYKSAQNLLLHLHEEAPNDYIVSLLLGNCYLGLNEPITAEACYSTCIGLWPENYIAYMHRGLARSRSQRFEAADSDFRQALARKPKFTPAIINRSMARMNSKRHADSVDDLSQAILLGRNDALVYFLRAKANKELGRLEQSEADLQSAMQRSPVSAQGWVHRSLVTRHTDASTALDELDEALRLNPRFPQALRNKAAILSQLQQNQAAINALSDLIEIRPRNGTAYLARGLLKAKLGQRKSAIADGLTGLRLAPSPIHHYQLARIFAQTGATENDDWRRAVSHIQQALGGQPRLAIVMEADQELAAVFEQPEVRTLLLTAKSLLQ